MPENLTTTPAASGLEGYNFAYLDEGTKRMVRRALLKAVAIPGYQVPFASREMPMPYGWGTGGIQVTASIIGRDDVLKVIDQGSDDTTNAVSIRRFFERTAAVTTTTHTGTPATGMKATRALMTKSLSARGSISLPKLVIRLSRRAILPSRWSV